MHLRRGGREQGASAVEFALVLPILVLLVFGIITFGIVFARTQGMEAAAREGARTASLGRDVDAGRVRTAVQNTAVPFINTQTDIDFEILAGPSPDSQVPTPSDWCQNTETLVTVVVRVTDAARYSLPIPLFRDITTDYEARGTFRCEAPHAD